MGTILCATRGGVDSQPTQQRAISLAQERGDRLVFLYVVDTTFLNMVAAPLVVDVASQLRQMGQFQLAMAQEQAAEQGIEAEIVIRQGPLRTKLMRVAQEVQASLIVLGYPKGAEARFDESDFQTFVAELRTKTGAEVVIVEL